MKKSMNLTLFKIPISIKYLNLCFLLILSSLGLLIAQALEINSRDKICLPFVLINTNDQLYMILFHNFLYFYLTPIVLLFCSTSYFGFGLVPIVIFVKSLFSGVYIYDFLIENNIQTFLLYCLVVSMELFILLIHSTQAIKLSLMLRSSDSEEIYRLSFSQAYLVTMIMTLITIVVSVIQFIF